MIIKLTQRERATLLAALRRWLSYPAAREADSIATNKGKHKPLDNAEIERLCKRITKIESKRDAALRLVNQRMVPASGKRSKLPGDAPIAGDGSARLRLIRATSTNTGEVPGYRR